MNVLSLFDGMSCGQLALQRANVHVSNYYASEIDKHAITVTMANFPSTIQLGSVIDIDTANLPTIDLLIGGSPCQGFSVAGKQLGMETICKLEITTLDQYLDLKEDGFKFEGQSYLFWEYIRILREAKPKYFFIENVKMAKKWKDVISKELGCESIEINSSLVSAQHRRRLYWTNIPNVEQPEDRNILLDEIVEHDLDGIDVTYDADGKYHALAQNKKHIRLNNNVPVPHSIYESRTEEGKRERRRLRALLGRDTTPRGVKYKEYLPLLSNKANCLVATASELDYIVDCEYKYRKLTITECEKLQTLPVGYTDYVSLSQRRKMIGNGWTVDVVSHIFKNI